MVARLETSLYQNAHCPYRQLAVGQTMSPQGKGPLEGRMIEVWVPLARCLWRKTLVMVSQTEKSEESSQKESMQTEVDLPPA